MSTILKALKKLEERKAAEGQRKGDIAWDILREQGRETERLLLWKWWLVGVAILLVVMLVFLWSTYRPLHTREQLLMTVPSPSSIERPTAQEKVPLSSSIVRPVSPEKVPPQFPAATSSPPVRPVAPSSPSGELSPIPADLKLSVSGIAYQESAEARMAIVNDLPVMVGTVIDGVIVEQIEEQRVIFSRGNIRFAVFLDSSL